MSNSSNTPVSSTSSAPATASNSTSNSSSNSTSNSTSVSSTNSSSNSTSNTLSSSFSETVTSFFSRLVADRLSKWLKNDKNIDISSEEICQQFEMEFTPTPLISGLPHGVNIGTQMPNIPNYMTGTSASPKRRGGRKKKAPVDPNGPKCQYKFIRGDNIGKICEKPVLNNGNPGSDRYCKDCIGKKTVKDEIKQSHSESKSTVKPPVVPGGMVSVVEQEDESNNTLDAESTDKEGFYREKTHGFIVQDKSGSIYSDQIDDNGTWRPLTQDERKLARVMGIKVPDSPVQKTVQVSVPVPAQIPQSKPVTPTQPTVIIPQIPAI